MTLDEIKAAVLNGKVVHWKNSGYVVKHTPEDEWHIVYVRNNGCIGLTWVDGVTLNGTEADFYICKKQ